MADYFLTKKKDKPVVVYMTMTCFTLEFDGVAPSSFLHHMRIIFRSCPYVCLSACCVTARSLNILDKQPPSRFR